MVEASDAVTRTDRSARRNRRPAFGPALSALLGLVAVVPGAAADQGAAPSLETLVAGPQRGAANRARDPYRHPLEDLRFLGIRPQDVVVEILPGGGGYWTEILAP